jgi:hypothetical protein
VRNEELVHMFTLDKNKVDDRRTMTLALDPRGPQSFQTFLGNIFFSKEKSKLWV